MAGNQVRCPECGSWKNRVVLTQTLEDESMVRRRACLACEHRWYAHQPPERALPAYTVRWQGKRVVLQGVRIELVHTLPSERCEGDVGLSDCSTMDGSR